MAIRWDKFTVKSQQAIQQAQARAAELGNPELQPVHLLLALIEDREGVIPAVLEKIGVPTEQLESDLHGIEEKLPRVAGAAAQPGLSQALNKLSTRPFARRRTSRTSTFQRSTCCWACRTSKATPRAMRWSPPAPRTTPS